jgi:hypothetical protein
MNKSIFSLLLSVCFQSILFGNSIAPILSDTIIQNYHVDDKIKATKTEALIRMKVTDFRQTKLGKVPIWVHNKQGQYWHGTTDENGEVFFLLPNNHSYETNVDQEENYRKFTIPKESKYFKTVKVVLMTSKVKETERNDTIFQDLAAGMTPTASRVLVKIKIADLDNAPLENEALYFVGQKSQKVYYSNTNAKGLSSLMLPKGDTYCIHSYAFQDITCKTFEESNTSRTSRFEFNTISTAEFRQRALDRQLLLARRDSIQRAYRLRDSMMLARNQYQNFYLHHHYENRDFKLIETNIKKVAQMDKEALTANQNYYTEIGDEIKSIFYRNKDQWSQKRIIANIDCSMYQYVDELMVWNYSNESEQKNNSYWLFNGFNYGGGHDGEDSPRSRGIFHVPQNNVEGFFTTIDKIVNFSCRGSRLENVVEALILGAEGKTPEEDLLFIADNYSDVKDLDKLKDLKVPVHVLLTASEYGVNENYLEIAYQSGGSVHTTNQDIDAEQLKALKNGDQLSIGKFSYKFYKGKFLMIS